MFIKALSRLPIFVLSGAMMVSSAAAQDLTIYGGAALQYYTKNDDGPSKTDLNGYVELEYGGLYGGIWSELTNWDDYTEVDYYIGYRGDVESFSYDLNYYYYVYPETPGGDDYGELGAVLGYQINDGLSIGTELYHQPEERGHSAYLTAAYTATDKISIDASFGRYYYDKDGEGFNEWELGIGYMLTDETGLELRYCDGEEYDEYLRLQLSWDSTILGG